MDNGLIQECTNELGTITSLNPYCNGQWSHTAMSRELTADEQRLNPYCNGQWSHTDTSDVP